MFTLTYIRFLCYWYTGADSTRVGPEVRGHIVLLGYKNAGKRLLGSLFFILLKLFNEIRSHSPRRIYT